MTNPLRPSHSAVRLALGLLALLLPLATRADVFPLASGAGGFSGGQTFNEVRAADVTLLAASGFALSGLSLEGIDIGSATSALVGARIYRSSTMELLAESDQTILGNGTVSFSLSIVLTPGESYRIGFYVETSPQFGASGTLFLPNQFPYSESSGVFRINGGWSSNDDTFPGNENLAIPQILVSGSVVPEPSVILLLSLLGGSAVWCARPRRLATSSPR